MSSDSEEEEELDPRIRDKLEELNEWTNNINKLEKQFEEMNALFMQTLNENTIKLQKMAQKLGKCVPEARPYFECRSKVAELQLKCQTAVQTFERSAELHSQSKETITIAESKFAANKTNDSDFDPFWQEILNQANTKFMEAKNLRNESQYEHNVCIQHYFDEQKCLSRLEKQFKSAIKKSKPYYEKSSEVQTQLNAIKTQIQSLNAVILDAKQTYSKTLKDLENISEEIHEKRSQMMAKSLKREPGVGAEYGNNCQHFCENGEEVPQIDPNIDEMQAMASLSPKTSLASRSPLGLSCSSLNTTEDDSPVPKTNAFIDSELSAETTAPVVDVVDTNGNSFSDQNDNQIEKSFVEIDLNN